MSHKIKTIYVTVMGWKKGNNTPVNSAWNIFLFNEK